MFLAPLAAHVPLAVLASILFVVCWNMSELKHCIQLIKQAPKSDILIMMVTFVLTVMVDLVFAVQIGVLVAIIYFLVKMAKSIDVELHELKDMTEPEDSASPDATTIVYQLQGPIFFGAVERLEQAMQIHKTDVKTIILRFAWVPMLDITALRSLEKLIHGWQEKGINVKVSGLNSILRDNLEKSGLLRKIGEENILAS
jgi:SulP family sulfate permease